MPIDQHDMNVGYIYSLPQRTKEYNDREARSPNNLRSPNFHSNQELIQHENNLV